MTISEQPELVSLDRIRAVIKPLDVINAVRSALIAQSRGQVQSPMPGQLVFDDPPGDCHIKFGHISGHPLYVVKIASSGYQNVRLGLPVNDGVFVVLSAKTGQIKSVLLDQGWLTAWRTAAAGALAGQALAPPEIREIGVLGAGLQARLQLEWLKEVVRCRRVVAWARRSERLQELCQDLEKLGFETAAASDPQQVLRRAQLVVTATVSNAPLFPADQVVQGTHITAVGADSAGKQELDPYCFARANLIATDDHVQCLTFGDFGSAVRAGAIASDADVSLGSILAGDVKICRKPGYITIADLTGIAAQDVAIAALVTSRLQSGSPA